jgi:hypothetical protein
MGLYFLVLLEIELQVDLRSKAHANVRLSNKFAAQEL